jgi:hypothetical protein
MARHCYYDVCGITGLLWKRTGFAWPLIMSCNRWYTAPIEWAPLLFTEAQPAAVIPKELRDTLSEAEVVWRRMRRSPRALDDWEDMMRRPDAPIDPRIMLDWVNLHETHVRKKGFDEQTNSRLDRTKERLMVRSSRSRSRRARKTVPQMDPRMREKA